MQPVCLSASLTDAVMRTHHFRSEVIYLARNFKVRSCSIYLSTYRCGLLLVKSRSKLFILHERHNVLFHFLLVLVFFFSPTKHQLFICITLTACWFVSFPKQLVTSRKGVLVVHARPLSVQKATLSPVIDCSVNMCRAGRFCNCRASALLPCCQPSPVPCSVSEKLPLGLDAVVGDPRRI